MTSPTTQDLLRKITYIETDIEIQRQILVSIPTNDTKEIEQTIKRIADKKKIIETLRDQIREVDPEEFTHIVKMENAVNLFRQMAVEKKFTHVTSRAGHAECSLQLKNKTLPCMAKACDATGRWTIIDMEGEVREYSHEETCEPIPESSS